MTKVPYGSATTKECVKCERSISRTSFSKHGKKCKGIKARESRVDIRKRSWVEHRAKRVSEQRSRRATQLFQKLEALRQELREVEHSALPDKSQPKGLRQHPLKKLSQNGPLFEYIFAQMDEIDLLSKAWFRKAYLLLYPDKRHWMPPEFQGEPAESLLQENAKYSEAL
ncbi:uncharacterized protein PITG_17278 [Phytophthora infestans T30-4]|uniref:Uncharacterized protein n=1 Tax=Phytophthora infestans (strain T30-4) TaxID=403677 RepID=D0NVP3_PHYIT|nr:uncharacterized protein PITG_17278 [Phytophthora infestans T30-4]EEY66724.1 conserved hypothetical protein [Phytophthora infestans T30-4]|eukprot:XP_002896789.1 conserved hypothetical protein [Phytophthora infestans T30-4]